MKVSLKRTQHLNSDAESFVYMAAHDLRSPLLSLKGLIALMQKESERENLAKYYELLEKSVEKMNSGINHVLLRLQHNFLDSAPKSIDLESLAEESIAILGNMEGASAIHFSITSEDVGLFFSDPLILRSAFENIISNAIRYRDEVKNSFLKIDITVRSGLYQISFEDNGIGMDEEIQNRIFDKFLLLSNSRGGSGLGLYIVKETLEKIGGKILVRSRLGVGAVFIIQVPNQISKMEV